jgi:hypothetical protein
MMIVLPETMKTATALNVRGGNGVWKKPKSLGNNKDGKPNKSVVGINKQ